MSKAENAAKAARKQVKPGFSIEQLQAAQLAGERLGRKQVIDSLNEIFNETDFIGLEKIKKSKAYKGLQVVSDGKIVIISTFEEYCLHVEGRSYSSLSKDLAKLKQLGEDQRLKPMDGGYPPLQVSPSKQQSVENVLSMGKQLIALKDSKPHGEWLPELKRLNIDTTAAKRMMRAVIRFSNQPALTVLLNAIPNKTMLFELLSLEDDELIELSEGGGVSGLRLDDIVKMNIKQLRMALNIMKSSLMSQQKNSV
jgi:hypothetical protein